MAVFTPRGLKISLDVDYCFALLARLYPKISPFKVLKMAEGLESIPGFLAVLTGLICFILHVEPLKIGFWVGGITIIGYLITVTGFYIIPGLPSLSAVYSNFTGFGIFYILLSVIGFFLVGWKGVLAFFIGRVIAGALNTIYGHMRFLRVHNETGLYLSGSERNFINAYRIYASKIGASTNVEVSENELNEQNWKTAFDSYMTQCPSQSSQSLDA
jgi:hypothetical protein